MNNDEKLYLMLALMRDIRGDWGSNLKERVNKVRSLAVELGHPGTIALVDDFEYDDGRHFRCDWSDGGYENAPKPFLETFSRELLVDMEELLNHPGGALPTQSDSRETANVSLKGDDRG